jgi:hypothetical protein
MGLKPTAQLEAIQLVQITVRMDRRKLDDLIEAFT